MLMASNFDAWHDACHGQPRRAPVHHNWMVVFYWIGESLWWDLTLDDGPAGEAYRARMDEQRPEDHYPDFCARFYK